MTAADTSTPNSPRDAMSPPLVVEITPNTPAAEALAANSSVKVSKLHKVARSTRLQASIRILKSAARTASGQPCHAGDRRGAPEFVAPNQQPAKQRPTGTPTILEEVENQARVNGEEASLDQSDDSTAGPPQNNIELIEDIQEKALAKSTPPLQLHQQQQQQQSVRLSSPPFTHATMSAAIAAACRAGEELERQRAISSSGGGSQKTPTLPILQLFRANSNHYVIPPSNGGEFVPSVQLAPSPDCMRRRSSEGSGDDRSEWQPTPLRRSTLGVFTDISKFDPEQLSDDNSNKEGEGTCQIDGSGLLTGVPADPSQSDNVDFLPLSTPRPTVEFEMPGNAKPEKKIQFDSNRTHETSATLRIKMPRKLSMKHIDDNFHFHGPRSVRNWVRVRRREIDDKETRMYVKGKVIDRQHELFIMSIAIMLGMRTSIGRTNMQIAEKSHTERRWLDNDDLMAVEKYVFPPRGSEITPPHQLNHTFKFKDYSPMAFAYLRRMFGVNEYDFLLSVCGNANYIEFQSNAKSGQFFFYSKDGKYMIKTMTNAECKFLRRITPHYFRHCAVNSNTLIPKFLGMYRVKLYHLRRNVKFVVMKSVYDTDKHLHQMFDLKGSSTGRDAKPGDAVKKDNDVRRSLPEGSFALESGLREMLKSQVERDCQWLKAMKIMDYSMLIGIHHIPHKSHKRTLSTPTKPKSKNIANIDDLSNDLQLQITPGNFPCEDLDDSSYASFEASHMTLAPYLDEDDDDSYLDGSSNQKHKVRVVASSSDAAVCDSGRKESEAYVEKSIEDMYWPFHRYYDLQGRRRMAPIKESRVAQMIKSDALSLRGDVQPYRIPSFEKPLSERKDGGFMMDLTDVTIPLKLSVPGAPHLAEYCDGKIFYMGIIDILQQFNIRKRVEARWRRMGGKGWEAASCVHPSIYADRFMRFFEEYTARSSHTGTDHD